MAQGSGTITALNGTVIANISGESTVVCNITGTWVATLSLQATVDGTNWFSISGYIPSTQSVISSVSTNAAIVISCAGYLQTQLIATAFTSGTASIAWNSSTAGINGILAQPSASGSTPVTSTLGTVAVSSATWTSATAVNSAVSVATIGYATALFTYNSNVGTATGGIITFEASDDGGTTYYSIRAVRTDNIVTNNQPINGNNGVLYAFQINCAGFTNVRARLSTVISGTVSIVVRIQASAVQTVREVVTGNLVGGATNLTTINDPSGNNVAALSTGQMKMANFGAAGAVTDAVITAATAPANAYAILSVNNTSAPSLTTGQSVAIQSDYQGNVFVKPYRRGQTVSKATTIASSSSATTVLAAQASGIFADISQLTITATPAATTPIQFTATLSDGTNSYLYDMDTGATATPSATGAFVCKFNPPLPATSAATAWTIALSVATVTVHITVVAVLQKAS